VNLAAASVEVHRDPDPASGSYRTISERQRGDALEAHAIPGFRFDLRELFD